MEALKFEANEHSSNIKANISVKDKEKLSEQDEEDISECEDNIYKLSKGGATLQLSWTSKTNPWTLT